MRNSFTLLQASSFESNFQSLAAKKKQRTPENYGAAAPGKQRTPENYSAGAAPPLGGGGSSSYPSAHTGVGGGGSSYDPGSYSRGGPPVGSHLNPVRPTGGGDALSSMMAGAPRALKPVAPPPRAAHQQGPSGGGYSRPGNLITGGGLSANMDQGGPPGSLSGDFRHGKGGGGPHPPGGGLSRNQMPPLGSLGGMGAGGASGGRGGPLPSLHGGGGGGPSLPGGGMMPGGLGPGGRSGFGAAARSMFG